MRINHGPQFVHDGAAADGHVEAHQRSDAVLDRRTFVVFARLAANGDVRLLNRQTILEGLDDVHQIRRDRAVGMPFRIERTVGTLMVRQFRPSRKSPLAGADEFEVRFLQMHGELSLDATAQPEFVFDADGLIVHRSDRRQENKSIESAGNLNCRKLLVRVRPIPLNRRLRFQFMEQLERRLDQLFAAAALHA